jgi:hypothetical protein
MHGVGARMAMTSGKAPGAPASRPEAPPLPHLPSPQAKDATKAQQDASKKLTHLGLQRGRPPRPGPMSPTMLLQTPQARPESQHACWRWRPRARQRGSAQLRSRAPARTPPRRQGPIHARSSTPRASCHHRSSSVRTVRTSPWAHFKGTQRNPSSPPNHHDAYTYAHMNTQAA